MEAHQLEKYGHLLDFTNLKQRENIRRCKKIGISNLIDLREHIVGEIHSIYKKKIMEKISEHYIFDSKKIKTKDLCYASYYEELTWKLDEDITKGEINFSKKIKTCYIFMYVMTDMICSKDFREIRYLFNLGFRLKEEIIYEQNLVKFVLSCPKIFANKKYEMCDWYLYTDYDSEKYEFFKSLNRV